MPTDEHGQTHAGAIGLFDDADEYAATTLRSERRERRELEAQIRRHERSAGRQHRKEVRTAQGKSKLPSWLAKIFRIDEKRGDDGDRTITVTEEWIVARRPVTPEPEYTAQDIDPADSLWLRECGMVRVKSDDAGGCHIVPKSSVKKSD
ncbi:hypothetical protein HBI24_201040 [Parastagonospora nodorum]|nr:hypothetical protein HBH51_189630 [Parastagonospora nodorum]KAH3994526.1 hypothetical protein HBI10_186120 [Parastagonospora nodorum]KAH4014339.1 hypothetical protein HBI13_172890 [Parastagonospora nodorum]KAH4022490.1 hypothetical protein HBI09_170140 [Parastagonospora nodorum]KAH4113560.1 hypothetical protein HBH47_208520 [Parastagonospora nodorum]